MGCGVWGVGCRVCGVGCGVWGVGCGVWGVGPPTVWYSGNSDRGCYRPLAMRKCRNCRRCRSCRNFLNLMLKSEQDSVNILLWLPIGGTNKGRV
ncbi:MAG: hypothetical protein F6J93_29370 [Oscillatoria sp. SIO1A7]|nr:hypothetical protein [Oscillatoria sp. SIO1A7]